MKEFLEFVAGLCILAALISFIVHVVPKFLGSDEAENYEKQIGIEMIKQYQRRIAELERDVVYYETICNPYKPFKPSIKGD